jgi:DNA modification methylase
VEKDDSMMEQQPFCVCGCGNLVRLHDGKGRHVRYFSAACRKRAQRMREASSDVTKIASDVTKLRDTIIQGDALALLKQLPDAFAQCCVTSPPYYGLRDYGVTSQIGLEKTPQDYIAKLVDLFREVRRVLRSDGTLWLNLGDSYAGSGKGGQPKMCSQHWQPAYAHKGTVYPGLSAKQLLGIPWRVALALQSDGWYLRSDVIWAKGNAMPESVEDRPTKAHEYLFLLAKSERYYYDAASIVEPTVSNHSSGNGFKRPARLSYQDANGAARGNDEQWHLRSTRNRRSVWLVNTTAYSGAHFAVMPLKLAEPCILAGSRPGDLVLDPFLGSGTVALVAKQQGRSYLGIELNPDYIRLAEERLASIPESLWQAISSEGDAS